MEARTLDFSPETPPKVLPLPSLEAFFLRSFSLSDCPPLAGSLPEGVAFFATFSNELYDPRTPFEPLGLELVLNLLTCEGV